MPGCATGRTRRIRTRRGISGRRRTRLRRVRQVRRAQPGRGRLGAERRRARDLLLLLHHGRGHAEPGGRGRGGHGADPRRLGRVGGALVQLAKRRGARAIAMASEAKHAEVATLGPDRILPRAPEDLRAALAGERVTVVADVVGGPAWPALIDVLARGGRYTCSGAIAGRGAARPARALPARPHLHRVHRGPGPVFRDVVGYVERGEVRPVLAATIRCGSSAPPSRRSSTSSTWETSRSCRRPVPQPSRRFRPEAGAGSVADAGSAPRRPGAGRRSQPNPLAITIAARHLSAGRARGARRRTRQNGRPAPSMSSPLAGIARFPRARLGHAPTPLERAPNLGAALGIELWIKRDDCTASRSAATRCASSSSTSARPGRGARTRFWRPAPCSRTWCASRPPPGAGSGWRFTSSWRTGCQARASSTGVRATCFWTGCWALRCIPIPRARTRRARTRR